MKNSRKTGHPVLAAVERNPEGMLSVWCPFCQRWHHHGTGEGHRVAHCMDPESPFLETGYVIKKIRPPRER